jgi:cation diffusion facilitator CzcD-associated flavoprotein CzcO
VGGWDKRVIAYLERFAATFELPVELNSAVRSLTVADGRFVVGLDDRRLEADQVVVATGPFQLSQAPAKTPLDGRHHLGDVHNLGFGNVGRSRADGRGIGR